MSSVGSHTDHHYQSEVDKNSLEKILPQLKCHFTWNLFKKESVSDDLEDRVCDQIEFLSHEFKATMYNLLAYIKHLNGQNEEALKCLQKAEEAIQQKHTEEAEIRSLVTWGNYAWVYYHLGRLSEAQAYVDKVRRVCEKFSNPYRIECPELDCEEGWALLQCGAQQSERVKVCFEKALEEKPNNPEFSSGLAIAMYCLDDKPPKQLCERALKQAIELNPDNQYIKVLLGLKLQRTNKEAEGESWVVEALEKAPCQTDVLRSAAKFYQKKGDLDKAIELLQKALPSLPNNRYLCHQFALCCQAKEQKIQNTEDSEAPRNIEKIEELRKQAMYYLKKAAKKGPNPLHANSDLTELETEQCYQTPCSKELSEANRKPLHPNFQEHHGRSEDTPVLHPLRTEKDKVKYQPQNEAENELPQSTGNDWYLQGLTHKLNGDLLQAAECFEKELGFLLRNSPSGISSFFLPASELEEGSVDVGQGAAAPVSMSSPTPELT